LQSTILKTCESKELPYHAFFRLCNYARLAQMQTLIEGLMANPGMENPFELHGAQEVHIVDTHSPRNVKQRSSVGSRPSDVFFFLCFMPP
jgi:hypothetical protein